MAIRFSWVWKDPDPTTGEKGVLMLKRISSYAKWRKRISATEIERVKRHYNVVLGEHFEVQNRRNESRVQDFYARHIADFDLWFYGTKASRDFVYERSGGISENVPHVRMPAVCYVIDQDFWRPDAESPKQYDFIVSYNDLIDYKRPEWALSLFRKWNTKNPGSVMVLLYTNAFGMALSDVKRMARQIAVEGGHVDLVRNPSPDEIRGYYQRSRYLLHPSATESAPRVIGEALSCGTPCVVPDEPWVESIDHLRSGLLVLKRKEWLVEVPTKKLVALGRKRVNLPNLVNTAKYLAQIDSKLAELNPIWTKGKLSVPQWIGGHEPPTTDSERLFVKLTGVRPA